MIDRDLFLWKEERKKMTRPWEVGRVKGRRKKGKKEEYLCDEPACIRFISVAGMYYTTGI